MLIMQGKWQFCIFHEFDPAPVIAGRAIRRDSAGSMVLAGGTASKKVLLVYPEFPETFWSFQSSLGFVGKKTNSPQIRSKVLGFSASKESGVAAELSCT